MHRGLREHVGAHLCRWRLCRCGFVGRAGGSTLGPAPRRAPLCLVGRLDRFEVLLELALLLDLGCLCLGVWRRLVAERISRVSPLHSLSRLTMPRPRRTSSTTAACRFLVLCLLVSSAAPSSGQPASSKSRFQGFRVPHNSTYPLSFFSRNSPPPEGAPALAFLARAPSDESLFATFLAGSTPSSSSRLEKSLWASFSRSSESPGASSSGRLSCPRGNASVHAVCTAPLLLLEPTTASCIHALMSVL